MPANPPTKEDFSYEIRSSRRARNLRLMIGRDGAIVVTKPASMPNVFARTFVSKHDEWIRTKLREFAKKPAPILGKRSIREYRAHKESAREIVHARIAHLNKRYGYLIASVRIGNQKSRWGSCSSKKNISFNYKIVFLPENLQDYVIVHELCHLRELNHGEKFWELVADHIPDWKKLRRELRKY